MQRQPRASVPAVLDRLLAEGMNVFGERRCIPGSPDDIAAAAEGGIPLKRLAAAAEIVAAVAFMTSPLMNSITGATLRIDGGLTPAV